VSVDAKKNPNNPVDFGTFSCGDGQPLTVIAGPCVIQTRELTYQIAEHLADVCQRLEINLIFKASFDKANRTSGKSYRGPGLQEGLKILDEVRSQFDVLVTTDFHESHQASAVGQVCDLIQVPAFLARQTDLLAAAAKTGKPVNVKKGQFMAPGDMRHVVGKLIEFGTRDILLTERGTFFGYGQLVNDMRSLVLMRDLRVPVVFDATHSVQQPGGLGDKTGGQSEMVAPLARAATAIGIDALFLETHPNPPDSPSDGPNMVRMDEIEALLASLVNLRRAIEPATLRI
jgi:2-dehydro-3-deoxyphosphooctonate aldolase (KDO 8-P synthase)